MAAKGYTSIGRSFKQLSDDLRKFNTEIRNSESNVRKLDSALKLDPSQIDLAREKYAQLGNAVAAAENRIKEVNKYQEEKKQGLASGKLTQEVYNVEIEKSNKLLAQYGHELKRLTILQNNAAKEVQKAALENSKFIKSIDNAIPKINAWQKAIAGIVASISALVYKSAELGKELVANAKLYDTSVESLQEQQYIFQQTTGEANAYTQALKALASAQGQIVSGRGQSQLQALSLIGLKESDISGMQAGEAYEVIFEALQRTEDAALRAAVAQKMFGDAGLAVAQVAGESEEAIEAYREQIEKVLISEELAQQLADMNDELYIAKLQFQLAGAEIAVQFAPVLKDLVEIFKEDLLPIFKSFVSLLSNKFMVAVLLAIMLLPTLAKIWKSLALVVKLFSAETWAAVKAKLALAGVSGTLVVALTGLAAAVGITAAMLSKEADATNEAAESYGNYEDAVSDAQAAVNKLNGTTSAAITASTETRNTKNVNLSLEIYGRGETKVSDESAVVVSRITANEINEALGALIGK